MKLINFDFFNGKSGDTWEGLDLKNVQSTIDEDQLKYEGDPMKFACIYNERYFFFEKNT